MSVFDTRPPTSDPTSITPAIGQSTNEYLDLAGDLVTKSGSVNASQEGFAKVTAKLKVGHSGSLTGKVRMDRRDDVLETLQRALRRACKDHAIAIEQISLMRQSDDNSSFRVIEQATLRPAR